MKKMLLRIFKSDSGHIDILLLIGFGIVTLFFCIPLIGRISCDMSNIRDNLGGIVVVSVFLFIMLIGVTTAPIARSMSIPTFIIVVLIIGITTYNFCKSKEPVPQSETKVEKTITPPNQTIYQTIPQILVFSYGNTTKIYVIL
jgi:hypothetical protein